MTARLAIGFGALMVLVGIAGFLPGLAPNGHLLGVFHVNEAHNIVHLLTGAAALICGFAGSRAAKLFFRIFGVVYGLVAVLGLVSGDQPVLGLIANNMADVWLHVGIAAVSLVIGFVVKEETGLQHAA